MPSNHLILCHPPLLLPSIFPSIRVFSNELALCIRSSGVGVSTSWYYVCRTVPTFVSPDSSRCLFMPAWQQKAAWGWTLHLWGAALLTFGHLHGSRDVCFIKLCYDASPSLFFFWHWSQTQPMGISLSWPLWPSGISPVALEHLHAFWDNQLPSSPCNFSSPYLESATAPRSSGLFFKMGNGI